MPKSNEKLQATINHNFDDTIARICNRLQKMSPSHYEIIDYERHQEREEEFMHLIEKAVATDDMDALNDHMERLAEKRSNDGYSIDEVLGAIDIIEDELWTTIAQSHAGKQETIAMLKTCNRLFMRIRTHFTKTFFDKQLTVQKRMNALKERFYIYRHDRRDMSDESDAST